MGGASALGASLGKQLGKEAGTDVSTQISGEIPGAEELKKKQDERFESAKERSAFAQDITQSQLGRLQERAKGEGPSIVDEQLKSVQDRTLAQQLAAAASRSRGASPASVGRALARSQADTAQGLAEKAVPARLQEQQQAEQMLAQRGAEEQRLADSLTQNFLAQGLDLATARLQAQQEAAKVRLQAETTTAGFRAGFAQQAGDRFESAFTAIGGAASDENAKENVTSGDKGVKSFLDALSAKSYNYKKEFKDHPMAGEGDFVSVMAQDLEKAGPVGKSMVGKDPTTGIKIVNYGKGFGAILAAQASLNKRLDSLEKKKKGDK